MTIVSGSIREYLTSKGSTLSVLEGDWVTFVRDHLGYLRVSSTVLPITPGDVEAFRYKLEQFLRENGCPIDIVWVVKIINRLDEYDDFSQRDYLIIPTKSDMIALREKFNTCNRAKTN